ncbi:hypothetical protein CHS0354_012430 [Potamilus streckersoni]|uniref:CUB domain-containing protein n=1 Tax=Potamilus streckersoni TaxID=2493646 RepID=A0AAE0VJQ2_9BIVA|nr:hypothetical protein CHS0354_012430 [Potamilus streckersoni]
MVIWWEGIALFMAYLMLYSDGVNPAKEHCLSFESEYHISRACECVTFQSYGLSQGRFHSPNFPQPSNHSIDCILYTFIGDVNELVQITFLEFDLKPPSINPSGPQCSDFLKLFLNIDRPEVNEHSKWDEVLCGNISNLKQKTYFSSSRSLILEYHTASKSSGHFTGFRGTFKFFNQADFRNDGHKQLGTQCSYFFQSSNNGTKGKFFSPRYPQNYPKDSNCQYIFMGHAKEKVIVRFQNIQLDNRESSCRSNPDTVRVYDGNQRDGKILREICGIHNQVDVMSSGQYMYIEFKSDHYHESQGFAATFEFTDDANLYTPQPPPQKNGETRSSSDNFTSCNMKIFSANAKNGTIESHSYPHPYPPSIRCQYELEGQGQERVQLSFKKMNLYYSGGDPDMPHGCINQDSISVFIYIDGKEILLGQYCGNKSPSQLMSNNQRMKVVFTSTSQSETRNVFGFQLEYNFRTDFGVQGSGIQDPRKGCLFHYNSTSSKVGFFTSPNFPGQYPPYTECNYQFHGLGKLKEERVFITFDDFYVGESGLHIQLPPW